MADHKPAKHPAHRATHASSGGVRSARPAARPKHGRHTKLKKFLWGLLVTILSLAIIAVIGVFVAYERTELPDPNHDFQTNTSFIYYRDGSRLGSFQSDAQGPAQRCRFSREPHLLDGSWHLGQGYGARRMGHFARW